VEDMEVEVVEEMNQSIVIIVTKWDISPEILLTQVNCSAMIYG